MRITGDSAEFWGRSGSRALFAILTMALMAITFLSASPAWAAPVLTVNKTDSPDPVTEGDILTYTIVVRNTGTDPATNVVLTDDLPDNTDFVSAETASGACPTTPAEGDPPGAGPSDVICNLGEILEGESATVTIKVRPTSTEPLNNTATATADGVALVTSNERTTVVPDLVIDKLDDRDPINVGGTSYTHFESPTKDLRL